LTAPKIAAGTPGSFVEGYWVDATACYFLAERLDAEIGRVVRTPSLAEIGSNTVRELISLPVLARLIAHATGQPLRLEALSEAIFDLPDRNTLAVTVDGRDCLVSLQEPAVVDVKAASSMPALYSPDGRYSCFIRGHDLWLRERASGVERSLTSGGLPHCSYGQLSDTELSTVSYRRSPSPVGFWSPDSQWFLTHRVDERSLPERAFVQHAPPGGGRPVLHTAKNPLPDDVMPSATYVAIHVNSGRIVSFPACTAAVSAYSAFHYRMVWFGSANQAWLLRRDRYCKRMELICLDLPSGTSRIVLQESAVSGYLDPCPSAIATPNVRLLSSSNEVIWFSERDGWGHLYLYDAAGNLKNRITSGSWIVRDIVHVDEERRRILFLAGGIDPHADPAHRALCSISLEGSGFEVLLAHDGDIWVPVTEPGGFGQERPHCPAGVRPGISHDGRFGLIRYASVDRGNRTEIVELRSRAALTIAAARPQSHDIPPRRFTATAADGTTRLHGVLFLPPQFDERQRYPLIVYIYPGPQIAHQPQAFRAVNAAPALSLAELGFITLMMDTRGAPISTRGFHQAGYPQLLEPQLADHAAVVRQLIERHTCIDGSRVGIVGHSAGGAAAARAMFDYADLYKVGVAVCGLHDAELGLATWSDKYRGPRDGRDRSGEANTAVAHKLAGKLLLISGDMDENVPLSQTLLLSDALIRANRDFDLLVVPNESHLLMMTSGYTVRRIWDYFVEHLLGATRPHGFALQFTPHELSRFASQYLCEFR